MNILLHGATNKQNFGDFLFAYMFYNELSKDNNVSFYESRLFGISNFYREHLSYKKYENKKEQLDKDLLVYISGGYLGEKKKSFIKSIVRYFRYFWLGNKFIKKNKKVVFIGVGGSPIYYSWLRKKIVNIMKASKLIIVRDEKTKNYYEQLGVKNIIVTTDTVLSLDCEKAIENCKNENIKRITDKNILLLHIYGSAGKDKKIIEDIIPAINKFTDKNENWHVIITNDNSLSENYNIDLVLNTIKCKNKSFYNYSNPFDLLNLINKSSIIITPKLHVGITSCLLEKSVLSYPIDYNKTSRFYNQISENNRCVQIDNINSDLVYDMLEEYKDKNIKIDTELINKSKNNLKILKEYIETEGE